MRVTSASYAQIRANAKYDKANTKKYILKLNINTDKDIIKCLDKQKNKQGFIKRLIRNEINKKEK